MKKILLYTAVIATIAFACSKLENGPVQNGKDSDPDGKDVKMVTETIKGGPSSTKATISNEDASFKWTAGDNIAVHISNGKYVYTSDDGASGASAAASSASFTVVYPEGYSRDAFAVYPSTIVSKDATNYGQSETSLNVTLPSSYTLDQVAGETGEKSPCPMIAANAPGSGWTFHQLCCLLRLTVKGIPTDATGLVIQFPGNKVNGSFSIASPVTPGTSTIQTGNPAIGEDKITITFGAGITEATVNIPLPTGTYEDVYITPVGSSTKVAAVRHINGASYTASRTRGKKLTTTLVSFTVDKGGKKVIFSPGNLQATYNASAKTWTWGFAAHQYDRIGNRAGNTTIITETKEGSEPYAKLSGDGTVDLFGRSTASTYYGIATTSTASCYNLSFVDWGNIDIDGNGSNYWYTLSELEWGYLTGRADGSGDKSKCRSGCGIVGGVSNALSTKAVITEIGVKGFIIFPDNFSGLTPDGVTWSDASTQDGSYKNSEKNFIPTIGTLDAWEALEAEGCVFLPVVGTRSGTSVYFNFSSNSDWSCYWSSTSNKVLRFNSDGFDPWQAWNQYYGEAVRLVHVIE